MAQTNTTTPETASPKRAGGTKLSKAALNTLALYAGPASVPPMNAATMQRAHDCLERLGLIEIVNLKWTVTDAGHAALANGGAR